MTQRVTSADSGGVGDAQRSFCVARNGALAAAAMINDGAGSIHRRCPMISPSASTKGTSRLHLRQSTRAPECRCCH